MKTRLAFLLFFAGSLSLTAQNRPEATPENPGQILTAQPDETVILPALRGIVLLSVAPSGTAAGATPSGVQTGNVPALDTPATHQGLQIFLGRPVSVASLGRLENVIRLQLAIVGRPFARVYTPPQDITDGTVRIVVQLAALDGAVRVDGSKWFSPESYTSALNVRPGEALDTAALNDDLAWLNRNPFHRVTPVIEAGAAPGTTRVTLRAEERFPLSLTAGYDNTGTKTTDENRVFAAVQWGNAFGRGDLLDYRFTADPHFEHMRSHSLGYTVFLPWHHVLSLQAALSDIDSLMLEPFTQSGKSWQVGARYEIPLHAPRPGWTQSLSFSADFKYSDNTLEFATLPITGNVTHIAEVGTTYGLTFPQLGGQGSAFLSAYASPGGLTAYNDDAAFNGSRPGAKARYAYGKLSLSHRRALGRGFSFNATLDAQLASGALLGSEQLSGTGVYAVRGYAENSAFGDWGVLGSSELHLPPMPLFAKRAVVDFYTFLDAASLNLRVDHVSTELASAGLGLNVHVLENLALRAAYGWQLKCLDHSTESGHAHVGASLSW